MPYGEYLEREIVQPAGLVSASHCTVRRVQDVAQEMGITIRVDKVLVTTQDQANELRFLGSPTVQISGQDIDPAARTATAFGFT
jgi:hypothetical protein